MNIAKRTINSLMQRSGRFIQSENSNLKYQVDYVAQLGSDTIATSTWTVESGSLTVTGGAESDNITSAVVSGSTGESRLVNKITTTTSGETIERIFRIKITDNSDECACDYGVPC
jgi:hypothetical protein